MPRCPCHCSLREALNSPCLPPQERLDFMPRWRQLPYLQSSNQWGRQPSLWSASCFFNWGGKFSSLCNLIDTSEIAVDESHTTWQEESRAWRSACKLDPAIQLHVLFLSMAGSRRPHRAGRQGCSTDRQSLTQRCYLTISMPSMIFFFH